MITLVSSPKQHLCKDMQHNVHTYWWSDHCSKVILYKSHGNTKYSYWGQYRVTNSTRNSWAAKPAQNQPQNSPNLIFFMIKKNSQNYLFTMTLGHCMHDQHLHLAFNSAQTSLLHVMEEKKTFEMTPVFHFCSATERKKRTIIIIADTFTELWDFLLSTVQQMVL